MKQAFLFDYGGTLDTAARHWAYVLHEGFTQAGVVLDEALFRPAYVYAERALACQPYITSRDDFFALLSKKVALEVEYLVHQGSWVPGSYAVQASLVEQVAIYCDAYARRHVQAARPLLEELAATHRLVMVSNFYGNLSTIVKSYNIAHCFDHIIESAVVGVRKPDPAIYALGIEAAGLAPQQCVVVGDSYTKDVLPAVTLGCETVWFKGQEWEHVDRDESVPTHVITSLGELRKYYL